MKLARLAPLIALCAFAPATSVAESALATHSRAFLTSCTPTMLESSSEQSTDCLINYALPITMDLAEQAGNRAFGPHFQIADSLSWDHRQGLLGDLDVVLPLAGQTAQPGLTGSDLTDTINAFFFQHGATLWMDEYGDKRHDVRLGLVHRFQSASSDALPGEGLFGMSLFQQHNVEYGHGRIVYGMDYATGPTSEVALHYYHPTTGWLAATPGYEERALEGAELSARLELPRDVSLTTAAGRWWVPGEDVQSQSNRLGVAWQYNRYLKMDANWRESGIDDGLSRGFDVGARLSIPLGGAKPAPSIKNLLRATPKQESLARANLRDKAWRPAEPEGQIRVVRREAPVSDSVEFDFVQDSAPTGNTIRIRVALASPATETVRYAVRLGPGDGDNPAVEGEDFDGAPLLAEIPAGMDEVIISTSLLVNPAMRTPRSLGMSIDHWSDGDAAQ